MSNQSQQELIQNQIKLVNYLNEVIKNKFKTSKYQFQVSKVNPYDEIKQPLRQIESSAFIIFPFDTEDGASYILFHRELSHTISELMIGLNESTKIKNGPPSVIETFSCHKICTYIQEHYQLQQKSISVSSTPTWIDFDLLDEIGNELMVSTITLTDSSPRKRNCYLLFPKKFIGDKL